MADEDVPQSAFSQSVNLLTPPLGNEPKAEALSSAAINCCNSCILV